MLVLKIFFVNWPAQTPNKGRERLKGQGYKITFIDCTFERIQVVGARILFHKLHIFCQKCSCFCCEHFCGEKTFCLRPVWISAHIKCEHLCIQMHIAWSG